MTTFVRKNNLVCSVSFTADDGSSTIPSAATLVLVYKDLSGSQKQTSILMTQTPGTNTWTAAWDSSAAGNCTVYWMVYGYGQLQAADEGCFDITANAANTV